MSRWRAAGIHLFISVLIALGLFVLVFLLWYPEPYFEAAGAQFLWILLVTIDVVIGPFLTLIIYKAGKRGLKFDLFFIATAQLIAMLYGFWIIAEARPAFVVFAVDRFNVVPANYVLPDSMAKAEYDEFAKLSWTGPVIAAAVVPTDRERLEVLRADTFSGYDIETHPEFFVPYDQLREEVINRGQSMMSLIERNPLQAGLIREHVADLGKTLDDVVFLPATATRRDVAIVIDKQNGDVLTALAVNPWGSVDEASP